VYTVSPLVGDNNNNNNSQTIRIVSASSPPIHEDNINEADKDAKCEDNANKK